MNAKKLINILLIATSFNLNADVVHYHSDGTKTVHQTKTSIHSGLLNPNRDTEWAKRWNHIEKKRNRYRPLVNKYSKKHQLDPKLIESLITVESMFNEKAISPKGAIGLMQLMPKTAERFGVVDREDPEQNIKAGTQYFSLLLKQFKSIDLALAAYNSGEGTVAKYGGIPPYKETQMYVKNIVHLYTNRGTQIEPMIAEY